MSEPQTVPAAPVTPVPPAADAKLATDDPKSATPARPATESHPVPAAPEK